MNAPTATETNAAHLDELDLVDQGVDDRQLRAALLEARKNIRKVAKGSTAKVSSKRTGTSYTYAFTSSEDMVEACVDALLDQGLMWSLVLWEIAEPLKGYQCPTLWGTFELDHPGSGACRVYRLPMPIASQNDADKAVAGAVTYLMGQAVRAVMQIPKSGADDQDPDKRTRDHGGRAWGNEPPRETQRAQPARPKVPPPKRNPPPPRAEPGKLDGLRTAVKERLGEVRKRDRSMSWDRVCGLAAVDNPKAPSPADLARLNDWLKDRLAALEGVPADDVDQTPPADEAEPSTRCAVCDRQAPEHAEGCPDAAPPPDGDEAQVEEPAKPEAKPEAPEPYDPGTPPGIDPETGEVVDPEAHDAWQQAEERAAIQDEGAAS